MAELSTDVRYIKGIGEKKAQAFHKLGVFSLYDLISYFPRKYEDRSQYKPIAQVLDGEQVCIRAIVADMPRLVRVRRHLRLLRKEEFERIIPCESYAKEKFDDNVPQPMRRNSKIIKRLDTGKIYASIKDFANAIQVTTTCVSAAIHNKKFKAKGIPFEVINGAG